MCSKTAPYSNGQMVNGTQQLMLQKMQQYIETTTACYQSIFLRINLSTLERERIFNHTDSNGLRDYMVL